MEMTYSSHKENRVDFAEAQVGGRVFVVAWRNLGRGRGTGWLQKIDDGVAHGSDDRICVRSVDEVERGGGGEW